MVSELEWHYVEHTPPPRPKSPSHSTDYFCAILLTNQLTNEEKKMDTGEMKTSPSW